MSEKLTLTHALSKNSMAELRQIAQKYSSGDKINPKKGKPDLIEDVYPLIPEKAKEEIIDETFNKPKTRFTAHVAMIDKEVPSEVEINKGCDSFDKSSKFDEDIPEYQTSYEQSIKLVTYTNKELVFYYTLFTKKPEYDFEAMESKTLVFSNKVRVIVKPEKNIVTVFTGNKDLFNNILTALTLVFGFPILPLNANKTGISSVIKGSFSFHTVKVLDFIYHGLSQIGIIGSINQISLETPNKSKNPQKVNVSGGTDLLDDKSICEYLFIYARDLAGVKLDISVDLDGEKHNVSIEVGIRDNRVKIGVTKENHSISRVKKFYEIIEKNIFENVKKMGLIDEENTIKLLDIIKKIAMD